MNMTLVALALALLPVVAANLVVDDAPKLRARSLQEPAAIDPGANLVSYMAMCLHRCGMNGFVEVGPMGEEDLRDKLDGCVEECKDDLDRAADRRSIEMPPMVESTMVICARNCDNDGAKLYTSEFAERAWSDADFGGCMDPCMGGCMDPCMDDCMDPCMDKCMDKCMPKCMDPCMGKCMPKCMPKCMEKAEDKVMKKVMGGGGKKKGKSSEDAGAEPGGPPTPEQEKAIGEGMAKAEKECEKHCEKDCEGHECEPRCEDKCEKKECKPDCEPDCKGDCEPDCKEDECEPKCGERAADAGMKAGQEAGVMATGALNECYSTCVPKEDAAAFFMGPSDVKFT